MIQGKCFKKTDLFKRTNFLTKMPTLTLPQSGSIQFIIVVITLTNISSVLYSVQFCVRHKLIFFPAIS